MKVLGIVAEYNPFHLGHSYHISTGKQLTDATHVVCVMSGNFLQRGEPAIVNKWARAEMALNYGVDLVLELPVCYSAQSAELFAFGAISSLHLTNTIDYLCFGSESGNIELIKTIAEILLDEPNKFKQILKKNLSKGLPFPKAQACALAGYISQYPNLGIDKEVITEFLKSPNNILGIEYLKALLSLESSIKPVTIKRFQSDYHSNEIINGITSARSIRKVILGSDKSDTLDNIRKNVPTKTLEILIREFSKGMGPISKDDYSQILLYNLSHLSENDLLEIFDVNEGLENRILQKSKKSGTFTELIKSLKTKRYTTTRLQRILTNMLININKTDIISFYKMGPQYLRVLGFTEKGQEIIRKLNNFSPVPVITKTAHYKKYNNRYLERMIEYDILATDIYSIAYQNPNMRQKGWDFFNNPIRI